MDDWDRLEETLTQDPATAAAILERSSRDEFALVVLSLRSAVGISQRELAVRAGITQPEVCRLERAEVQPLWETVQRVFGALGVEVTLKVTSKDGKVVRRRLRAPSTPRSPGSLRARNVQTERRAS